MSIRRICNFLFAAQLAFLFGIPPMARADALDNAVRSLARRTLPMKLSDSSACVDWQNHAAVSDARSVELHALFLTEVGIAKAAPSAGEGNCPLKVSVERTPTKIVFVAQVAGSSGEHVLLSEVPRAEAPAADNSGAPIQMEKELLMQQAARILDAAELKDPTGNGSSLIVLTRDAVSFYHSETNGWNLVRMQPMTHGGDVQRVPRGELQFLTGDASAMQILLPGRTCRASLSASGPITCVSSDASWRADSLPVSCDGVAESLGTEGGDWSQPDRILLTNQLLPKSQTPLAGVSVPGPVLSLSPGNMANIFTAIVFNLATGNYEVYRITLVCRN